MILDDNLNLGENIPRSLSIFASIKYLLHGCTMQFAFLIGIIAAILFWAIGINSEIMSFSFFGKNWVEAIGIFNEETGVKVDVYDIYQRGVYKYEFTYEVNGQIFENISYANTSWTGGPNVIILYNLNNPSEAIIDMMRSEIYNFRFGFIFSGIPILIASFFFLRGFWQNLKLISLLRNGIFIKAKVVIKDMSKKIYGRYYYNFEIDGTKYKSDFFGVKDEDVDEEKVLYLPSNPNNHLPLLILVNSNKMDKFGKILEPNYSFFGVFLLPSVFIAVNIIGWFLH